MPREFDLVVRLLALREGRAQLIATRRQVAVRPDALIVCPLAMAGEDTALHLIAWGHPGEPARIACAPDPRRPDDRARLFATLGAALEQYAVGCARAGTYPQIWVPSAPAADLLDALSERLRIARDERLRRCGELLAYAAERYPMPGQQALHAATGALTMHWATGQSAGDDEHLGRVLAWIAPPAGTPAPQAALAAAREPMGVHAEPIFDQTVLAPLVKAYNQARQRRASTAALERSIREALEPIARRIYSATQQAIALLLASELPPLPDLPHLETLEAEAFAHFLRLREQGVPVPLRDGPQRAAFTLGAQEETLDHVAAARLLGDELARARARLEGAILVGAVANPQIRPLPAGQRELAFTIVSLQRALHLRVRDTLLFAADPRLQVAVTAINRDGPQTRVDVRIIQGQRAVGLPAAGVEVEFVPAVPDWNWLRQQRARLGKRLKTRPWTHADGPLPEQPARPVPADPLAAVEALR